MAEKGKYSYDWPRPMVTVDAAVFAYFDSKPNILLISRANEPFKGKWALPGGFVEMDEPLKEAATRELAEETNLTNVTLKQLHTFGTLGRDPRGRLITIVYWGIADTNADKIKPGDDAAKAQWFDIENIPEDMAFDHNHVIKLAIRKLNNSF